MATTTFPSYCLIQAINDTYDKWTICITTTEASKTATAGDKLRMSQSLKPTPV